MHVRLSTEDTDKDNLMVTAVLMDEMADGSAFEAYMREIKDAGVRIDVTSQDGDYLRLDMTVFYNPLLITAEGESKADGSKVAELADTLAAEIEADGIASAEDAENEDGKDGEDDI